MLTDAYQPYVFPNLTRLFSPRSIVVIGASEKPHSIGNLAMQNIVEHSGFKGEVYPVNPKQDSVMGLTCYPDVASLPKPADVVVVVIPAGGVCAAVEQAGEIGCAFAVILTSGFSEADDWGRAEEAKLVEISQRSGIRIYGPNCPGLVNLNLPLGMTFSPAFKDDIAPGPIGLATQGGGLGRNMIQHNERGAQFGLWSSSGNECDLQVADFVHHMAQDPDIKVIGCLVEGFKDGARFAAACAEAARRGKPVVGLKVGRSEYGARAAASHTASITGSAEVNSTVFRQLGVVEVDDLDELVDVAMLFCRKMPTGDEQIAVFASSGGAASLCADNVGMAGLTLAEFTSETSARLAEALPAYANMSNPIDTTSISISHPDAYREALAACAADANVGLVLAPLPMDYGSYSVVNAESLKAVQDGVDVPIVPIWMSERQGEGYHTLARAGLGPLKSLRNMRKALRRWVDYGAWRAAQDSEWRPAIIRTGSGGEPGATRTLNEIEGKQALAAAGVPVTAPEIAQTAEDAVRIAGAMGGRLAMKIVSPQIVHKSDVGGVRLGETVDTAKFAYDQIITNVREASPKAELSGVLIEPMAPEGGIEAFVGVSCDPVFGQVMTFGLGGIYVEMFADVTRRMLPITQAMAMDMIGELKSARLLTGYRGQPTRDLEALAALIARVSDFAEATPGLIEMDINPVWVGTEGEGAIALDAVLVVKA
ncbi:acetate--CoA ligase family protein [Sulfitobacter sp. DFL-23]|uniref:Succinyl-CoA synthetase subunit alpha n=2 Tax=Pseudosulfitobacter pseudonitzschiae TaxID=1402135 RepID=A0A221K7L8_9RHOB|nr:acetate--CoA ligase family protein [Sulfitobacter sp. DFL-23]ASM74994.1 succinyl-CoA synthetase subunit alpha [Pseudosulfitobacter pseudonitzschiae]